MGPLDEYPPWVYELAYFSPAILFLIYFVYQRIAMSKWEKGIFPQKLGFNKNNLMKAYICLAARLIQVDREGAKEKLHYLHSHFNRYFEEEEYDIADALRFSSENPVRIKTGALWLNAKLSNEQRIQVLYFMVGLCFVDGSLNAREYALLNETVEILGISPKDYQSILSMYQQRHQRREEPQKQTRPSAIRLSSQILGVAESASLDEIKKAYRSMAKLHHPDLFATEGPEQQRIAQERFVEIQTAYEILEKRRLS
ncbi:MAG: hypothetical protein A3D92_14370 [Bacteroidetes bacterium RIFCSPHIGHO2_02_FULL_44_7]|nr:MAG: hypothetical protein A3D92_14370 [Bacteroidetes bacterium RIFCSPHIGHO2_02_FULL_44_7]